MKKLILVTALSTVPCFAMASLDYGPAGYSAVGTNSTVNVTANVPEKCVYKVGELDVDFGDVGRNYATQQSSDVSVWCNFTTAKKFLKVTSENDFKLKGDEDEIKYRVKLKTKYGESLTAYANNRISSTKPIYEGDSQLLFDIKNVSGLESSGSYSDTLTVAFIAK
ncbi:hypothetical protein ACPV5T_10755 [Vibrio astriarenae]